MSNKKNVTVISGAFTLLLLSSTCLLAQNNQQQEPYPGVNAEKNIPKSIGLKVQSFYRHRKDGMAGREVMLYFKGAKFSGKGSVEVECGERKEATALDIKEGIDSLAVLLPPDAGVKSDCEAKFILKSGGKELKAAASVPALRQWTVYIYPHSHVDIGYTNTQANVEVIHRRNLEYGIELAKKTASYPEGARFVWNPEVLWPVERYLNKATPQQKAYVIDAVKKGYLHLDASYCNTNTSMAADEEMFEFLGHGKELEKLTGTKIETYVQVDVPGMSWGIVPAAAKNGVKYIYALNNGFGRVGRSITMSFKPFWWLAPDGKSKVLFLQPGSYTPGVNAKGLDLALKMLGQTDTAKLLKVVKTDHPREHFVDHYLNQKLPELGKMESDYPYDIFAMSWSMADNTPVDADLPEGVKSWNEEYAFPHLIIASATETMQAFEKKYGDQLPVLSGDFTEYWTDGLGSAAKQTSMNRASKERLIQDETLWAMLHPGKPAPHAEIKEAWRNVSLGTEHTWCYFSPDKQPITNDILNVKFGYFETAEDKSKSLMDEALASVNQNGSSTIGVFNTLSWSRTGLVSVSKEQSQGFNSIKDEVGNTVVSQRLSTGELVFVAKDIPALGSKKYVLQNKQNNATGNFVKGNTLDNGIVRVVVDQQTGDISRLSSGQNEFVDTKAPCQLNSYRYLRSDDEPEKATGSSNVKISAKENGPLLASVLVESQAEGCNSLTREVTIIAGQPFIEIRNVVDKKAILNKEGIHFGFAFNIEKPTTRADIPWGVMQIDKDQLSGANRNWIGFQRWLDISNNKKGVTWCSLDAPVFEVGNMTANLLGNSTNSLAWLTKLNPSATIYSWALNNHWYTNFPLSQEGKITFRYRVWPHNSGYNAGLSNRFGLEQAQPLIVSPVKDNIQSSPLLSLEGSANVSVSILKTDSTGNSTVVRLRSVSNKDEQVKLNWLSRKPQSVVVLDNNKEASGSVVVPAMGFITVEAKFAAIFKK
jgi:hypothetical protein